MNNVDNEDSAKEEVFAALERISRRVEAREQAEQLKAEKQQRERLLALKRQEQAREEQRLKRLEMQEMETQDNNWWVCDPVLLRMAYEVQENIKDKYGDNTKKAEKVLRKAASKMGAIPLEPLRAAMTFIIPLGMLYFAYNQGPELQAQYEGLHPVTYWIIALFLSITTGIFNHLWYVWAVKRYAKKRMKSHCGAVALLGTLKYELGQSIKPKEFNMLRLRKMARDYQKFKNLIDNYIREKLAGYRHQKEQLIALAKFQKAFYEHANEKAEGSNLMQNVQAKTTSKPKGFKGLIGAALAGMGATGLAQATGFYQENYAPGIGTSPNFMLLTPEGVIPVSGGSMSSTTTYIPQGFGDVVAAENYDPTPSYGSVGVGVDAATGEVGYGVNVGGGVVAGGDSFTPSYDYVDYGGGHDYGGGGGGFGGSGGF